MLNLLCKEELTFGHFSVLDATLNIKPHLSLSKPEMRCRQRFPAFKGSGGVLTVN